MSNFRNVAVDPGIGALGNPKVAVVFVLLGSQALVGLGNTALSHVFKMWWLFLNFLLSYIHQLTVSLFLSCFCFQIFPCTLLYSVVILLIIIVKRHSLKMPSFFSATSVSPSKSLCNLSLTKCSLSMSNLFLKHLPWSTITSLLKLGACSRILWQLEPSPSAVI